MKTIGQVQFVAFVVAAICLCGCCAKQEHTPGMQLLDTLPKEGEMPVHTKAGLNTGSISAEDLQGIYSAIARTPNIDYEIQAVSVFPDQHRPMAACVRTQKFLLFLCQPGVGGWHVFRIASYDY